MGVVTRLNNIIERLAEIEHDRWAHWQRYMHGKCEQRHDGSLVVPPNLVAQWEKQLATSYCDLTEQEKESDRAQVRKYLPTIVEALTD